ncbi:hypothetical protein [Catellatospora sp. NPDC049133]|uniref:hypothetical protein n=1 Tax=Catellatospora sp. NPDC049133 TaxID=3155499 RepID=UPI0033F40F3B
MSAPRVTLYDHGGNTYAQPSGGLLWVLLKQFDDVPGRTSLWLGRDESESDFMQVWRMADGYRLLVQQREGSPPALAHQVGFDVAFAALLAWNLGHDTWRTACDWRPVSWPPAPDTPPALIRIAYEPDHGRTDRIGRYADGQFFAIVHGTRRNALGDIGVALLLFDHTGTYTGSRIHNDVPGDEAHGLREQLIAELPDVAYGDIAVRPFSVREGDIAWELVDQTAKHGMPRVSLYPMDIMFAPPWDGAYDT